MTLPLIKRFWNLIAQYKIEIRQIYLLGLLTGVVNLTLPLGIQAIINFLQAGELTSTWVLLVSFVLFGTAMIGILQVLQLRIMEDIQQELFARSAFEFTFRLPKISLLELDRMHAPELANRFFDTLTIQKGLPKVVIDLSLSVFQIFFGLILLAIYSPYFILLGFALAGILWIIVKTTGAKGLSTSVAESKYKYRMAYWLEEIARVNRSFKLYAKSSFYLDKTDDIVSDYTKSREKHFQVLKRQFSLFIALKVIVAASLLVLGGVLVFNERMNIGQFVAAEIIIILIISSVEKLLHSIDIIYDILTALDKIGFVTDLKLDSNKGHAVLNPTTGVSIDAKNIQFGFPDEKRKVIDDLSFSVKSNEKVVLSGKSGSGKSLLLQLLGGLYEIGEGELYLNNMPISNYRRNELCTAVGISFPSNQIFDGTLRENITMGRDISNNQLDDVIELLGLQSYVINLEQGLDSLLDSGGRRLPRSIIQKLHIARIIIGEPKLLLIEDPLLFIDENEKKRIVDYLTDPKRNWTLIVISDFSYWKEKCERIIDLDTL